MMIASKRLAHNVEMQKMQAELLAVVDVSLAPPSCDPPAARRAVLRCEAVRYVTGSWPAASHAPLRS